MAACLLACGTTIGCGDELAPDTPVDDGGGGADAGDDGDAGGRGGDGGGASDADAQPPGMDGSLDAGDDGGPDPDDDGGAPSADGGDATVDAGPTITLACADALASASGTPAASGTLVAGASGDDQAPSCGGVAVDLAFEWVAPATDYYVLGTASSAVADTVLALYDDCGGSELACNNNTASSTHARIVRRFAAGERVLAVVEGALGEEGDVGFDAERVSCPGTDLAGQTFPVTTSTASGSDAHDGACGGGGQLERSFRYTPATSGLYRFTVSSEEFAPAIYLERGPICGGELVQCNAALNPSQYPAEITRYLTADEPVTLIVDSASGSGFFDLNVEMLGDACPSEGASGPPAMATFSGSHLLSGSCVPAGGGSLSGDVGLADISYTLEHDVPVTGLCTYTIHGTLPFTAYLLRDDCGGVEHACEVAVDDSGTYEASFRLDYDDVGTYVIVIESASGDPVSFEYGMSFACLA